jgi:ubiquitin carboxyl-terminal hydrolase 34
MVDFEGDQVNDNTMYQFMKMMSFLELSERQDYNPREFCFSFKGYDG